MKFIKLTDRETGCQILVNAALVTAIKHRLSWRNQPYTRLCTTDAAYNVTETPDQIAAMLEEKQP